MNEDDGDDEVGFELDGKKKKQHNDNSIDEAEKLTCNKTCDTINGDEGGLSLWKNALYISK